MQVPDSLISLEHINGFHNLEMIVKLAAGYNKTAVDEFTLNLQPATENTAGNFKLQPFMVYNADNT